MKMNAVIGFIATALLFYGCGGGSGSSGTSSTGGSTSNPLAVTFPGDLAITSPFASTKASANVAVKGILKGGGEAEEPPILKSFQERKDEINNMLVGNSKTECAFSLDLFKQPPEANCYGPNISYHNHQDAGNDPGRLNGALPGGDTGIWAEYNFGLSPSEGTTVSTGEACAAAKINNLMSNVSFKVDTAVNMFAGMLCMAKVDGQTTLPEVGVSKDLKSSFDKIATDIGGIEITEATIAREADTADGYAIYHSHITATISKGDKSAVLDVHLKHIPENTDNTTYKGKLWYTLKSEDSALPADTPNCGFGMSNVKQIASSILYSKDATNNLSYHVRNGTYCSTSVEPFDSKHNVDPSKKGEYQNPTADGWGGNFTMGTFLVNADDGTGQFSYAWQAGPQDGWTRTFIARLANEAGNVSGCGYFGYGPDVAANGVGDISGFICNWAGPGSQTFNQKEPLQLAQKQCMTRAANEVFKSDSENLHITYAPSLTCDVDNAHQNFTYRSGLGGDDLKENIPADITNNDKRDAGILTNNLADVADVPAPPTPPSDIE